MKTFAQFQQDLEERISLPSAVAAIFNQSTASGDVKVGKDKYGNDIRMQKLTTKKVEEQLSLAQAFAKVGKPGGGVGDWESGTSQLRRPRPVPITRLNQASYLDRIKAGRRSDKAQDNPNYVGPVRNAGRGTGDVRMPGTTPSQIADLDAPNKVKKDVPVSKSLPRSRTDRPRPLDNFLKGGAPI